MCHLCIIYNILFLFLSYFSIYELAQQHEIQLDLVDLNLHFIEKTVPFYEQAKMGSVKDLKDYIEVYDFMEVNIEDDQKEDFTDYLHRKMSCQLKIDEEKRQYYNNTQNVNTNMKTPLASFNEFIFDETFPDGKLSIPDRDDKNFQDTYVNDVSHEETTLSKFREMYNVNFSNTEEMAMLKNVRLEKKQKRKPLRGADGKFVKQNDTEHNSEDSNGDYCTKQTEVDNFEIKNIPPKTPDICNVNNTSVFNDFMKIKIRNNDQLENNSKIFGITIDKSSHKFDDKKENSFRLFRAFKDYWMYNCNFSRVKPKNFELFEKMLPRSFRWLLNECANVVEMSLEDLYEEVCLVETYYVNVSEQLEIRTNVNNCNQMHFNAVLKRW